jgi:hypothetical protein
VNATTVTANFVIDPEAAASTRNVRITTPAGTSNTIAFQVQRPALTSISPNAGTRGTPGRPMTVPVTLTGTDLTGAMAIFVSGGGLTVNSINVVNATTVTANFVINAGANPSSRNVAVLTPRGITNTVAFQVQ